MKLLIGDCREVMATLDESSVDAIVTDPPYGLEFMGKEWDAIGKSGVQRKATEGGGDKRAIVDPVKWAGRSGVSSAFSRSRVRWQHGAAGPKAMQEWHREWANAALRVLKPGGHLLAFGGTRTYHRLACAIEDAGFEIRDCLAWLYGSGFPKSKNIGGGFGTALKPAFEPIILARKPLSEKNVAANVQRHGTGAINVDGCRIGPPQNAHRPGRGASNGNHADTLPSLPPDWGAWESTKGRWPANVILDEGEAARMLDEQSGEGREIGFGDSGGASRFFFTAKASRAEREEGCTGPLLEIYPQNNSTDNATAGERVRNNHPTVKPVALMRWLVRLVTPPGGTVLDPFLGSGSTGIAAKLEGFDFVGIEREAEYVAIAERRIANANSYALAEESDEQPGLFGEGQQGLF